jgi:DNA integrity scanning protein DisA with diadenylate cyclase activity
LKLRKPLLAESNGIRIVNKPKEKVYKSADCAAYNKNSIFGLAVDSVQKLCDQKKLVMYFSPIFKEKKREQQPDQPGETMLINAENPERNQKTGEMPAGKSIDLLQAGEESDSFVGSQSPAPAGIDLASGMNAIDSTVNAPSPSIITESPEAEQSSRETMLQSTVSSSQAYTIEPFEEQATPTTTRNIDEVIGLAATSIGRDVGANCIISVERKHSQLTSEPCDEDKFIDVEVVIFRKTRRNAYKKVMYRTKMRKLLQGSILPVKDLLSEAIKREYIKKGDRVVCVENESIGLGYKGMLFIFDVDNIFFNISMAHLTDVINSDILEAIINISMEIGKDGFEGKPVGTAFVIGDKSELAPYTKQMIINPFMSCPEEQRKITDPALKDTIKNFAQLDGAFIIDKGGAVVSAGTYLNVDVDRELSDSLSGLGTRHRCCAAITKTTKSIAVVVSQSGGKIRIFKEGHLIMRMP